MQTTTSPQPIAYTYTELWVSTITGTARWQGARTDNGKFVVMQVVDASSEIEVLVHAADFDALVEAGWTSGDRAHFAGVSDSRTGFIARTVTI